MITTHAALTEYVKRMREETGETLIYAYCRAADGWCDLREIYGDPVRLRKSPLPSTALPDDEYDAALDRQSRCMERAVRERETVDLDALAEWVD